ncbi:MAG: ATP-binding cassette domain-containing protein [Lachnospiraceae bacterium]|nr:ATP-binding cassette domain-containing protein [Lachnospiraceae bacterium]
MSWFGEQIQNRINKDRDSVSEALVSISDAIGGKARFRGKENEIDVARAEVEKICHYFELETPESIPKTDNINDMIDYIVRPTGIMRRRVLLEEGWWSHGDGPLLAVLKDTGKMCAILPGKLSGYRFFDSKSGTWQKVNKQNRQLFENDAVCFYRPFPNKSMTGMDLIKFILKNVARNDYILIILSTFLMTAFGILTPLITQVVFSHIIPSGKFDLLASSMAMLIAAALGVYLVTTVKTAVVSRITNRMDTLLQNGVMGRMLGLPVKFFSDKSSGALSQSIGAMTVLPVILSDVFFGVGISVIMSLLYVVQVAVMAPALAIPAFITFVLEILIIGICLKQKTWKTGNQLKADQDINGLVYALFSGIQKIKLSGSENRAFSKWAVLYNDKVRSTYKLYFPEFMQEELVVFIQMIGMLLSFLSAANASVSVADFAAYSSAFGLVMASILLLSASGDYMAYLKPVLKMAEPILEATPEVSARKKAIDKLQGGIELNGISFQYDADCPMIIDNLSLKIKPGEYVAIVGKSGCGKSTLMRLMLGFETPNDGAIYYDGKDLSTIDLASFRRNVGTVLQSGKLFAGDIFSNITISAPWLKMDDAWEAARMAGMEETIQSMPMGMDTFISEGNGGISGGQKQRLMIARAIAPKPSILMFDEATSALDNITQKIVSDSLDNLKCTRIVIAHRLSTIKNCDRIIVLDGGRIVEDGKYEDLVAKDGVFADLVRRQQVDNQSASA